MSIDLPQREKDEVARELLAYLADHPAAKDSLDGIVQWWLLERKIRQQVDLVSEVLDALVREGRLAEECGPDGTIRYCLMQMQSPEGPDAGKERTRRAKSVTGREQS